MTERLVWFGELAGKRSLQVRGLLLLAGGLLWLLLFLALPAVVLLAVAFATRGEFGAVEWTFSTGNLWRVLGYETAGWSPTNLRVLGRSIMVALVTTALCIVLAYPLAFYIAAKPPRSRYLWLTLVIIPLCTNLVVRLTAWKLLLARELPLARLAHALGWLDADLGLDPGLPAVYLGMISTFLPFAALPLYASVERLDWSIVEAARDLYAGRWRVFRHAILPQTIPGLMVALVLTFVPAMGMFVVPAMLGGSRYMLVGELVQQQFKTSQDPPYGAALSLGLMALTLLGLWLYRKAGRQGGMP